MSNKILKILSIVPEPRVERSKLHSLTDVLFIYCLVRNYCRS